MRTSRLEVGTFTLGHGVDVDGMFAGRKIFQIQFDVDTGFCAFGHRRKNRRADSGAGCVLKMDGGGLRDGDSGAQGRTEYDSGNKED